MVAALHGLSPLGWLAALCGFAAVASAIVHAAAPGRAWFGASIALIGTALAAGLLGTVLGMAQAYRAVASVDPSMKAALLAEGISEAMNATAAGLTALALWVAPFVIGTVRWRRARR